NDCFNSYVYDENGNLIALLSKDGNNATIDSLDYNSKGQVIRIKTYFDYAGDIEKGYTYNLVCQGDLVKERISIRPNGSLSSMYSYSHDERGNMYLSTFFEFGEKEGEKKNEDQTEYKFDNKNNVFKNVNIKSFFREDGCCYVNNTIEKIYKSKTLSSVEKFTIEYNEDDYPVKVTGENNYTLYEYKSVEK
ncbi:MAG: hypothetical protein ACEPOW_05555, partial [Bacteroidales bacterium]